MSTSLTATERKTLTKCEKVIQKNLAAFVEVGQALFDIRTDKLYRASHATFEAYCQERWDIGKSQAYRLIASAEAVANLSPIGDVLPANEAQARPLTTIPMEQVGDVWQEAIETAPTDDDGQPIITAKHVEETVQHWQEADEPYVEPEEVEEDEPPEEPELSDDDQLLASIEEMIREQFDERLAVAAARLDTLAANLRAEL
jgi:hypothetical protein